MIQRTPHELADSVRQVYNKILALDQASTTSGWSFFIGEKLTDYGHWTFSSSLDIAARIHNLCQQIASKIDEFEPDLVVIENIQDQKNINTFQKLAWVQGAILLLLKYKGIPYRLMYPTEWRAECKFLQGKDKHRTAQKAIAQQWVLDTYGCRCTQDEADAICIGHATSQIENNVIEF